GIDAEADIGEESAVLLGAGDEKGSGGVDPPIVADIAVMGVAGDDDVDAAVQPGKDRQQVPAHPPAAMVVIAHPGAETLVDQHDHRVSTLGTQLAGGDVDRVRLVLDGEPGYAGRPDQGRPI